MAKPMSRTPSQNKAIGITLKYLYGKGPRKFTWLAVKFLICAWLLSRTQVRLRRVSLGLGNKRHYLSSQNSLLLNIEVKKRSSLFLVTYMVFLAIR